LLRLAAFPNVLVNISGLYAVSDPAHAYPHESASPFLEILFQRFGAARCCWGSDFSPALDYVNFPQAVDIPWLRRLPPADFERVMGGNLLALLRYAGEEDASMGKPKDEKPIDPEALVDEAIEETFPASDPISPGVGPGEPIEQPKRPERKSPK